MGRKLPWAASKESGGVHGSARTPKRTNQAQHLTQNTIDPSSTPISSADAPTTSAQRNKRRGKSRSPSTSPPPGPPDVEQMREGLDADDGYMMVEDEFQTIAQSYTAHLHHAEYKRLMRNAKDARRAKIPELSSEMSEEVKMKLQQAALSDKQKAGLDRMTKRSTRNEDDLVTAEEENISDPWAGTSLAGLMASSSQPKTSLKGLERLSSSTKAAKGYMPFGNQQFYDKTDHRDGETQANRGATQNETSFSHERPLLTEGATSVVEAWTRKRPRIMLEPTEPATLISNRSASTDAESRKSQKVMKSFRNRIDDLDDFDEESFDRVNDLIPPQLKIESVFNTKSKNANNRKSRLDEVPLFLA